MIRLDTFGIVFSKYILLLYSWKIQTTLQILLIGKVQCLYNNITKMVALTWNLYNFFEDFIYFFLERGEEREKERERNINVWEIPGCFLHTPNWGPGLKPRHVPWLGIEPATFRFTGWISIHWATPPRAETYLILLISVTPINFLKKEWWHFSSDTTLLKPLQDV